MGRSVLYIPGIQDISDIQTVAGLVILESVAKLTAKYETPITVPVTYPIPFTIAEEMVKGGYLHAGRPEAYDPDSVRFVSPEQFAYVASVTGIMMRDKPAAHIFMGSFFAESLLLAETGFATGAIQVAGTANVHQLPFFVVACDYTLIGEELYAASAYLSGDLPVGALKAPTSCDRHHHHGDRRPRARDHGPALAHAVDGDQCTRIPPFLTAVTGCS